MRLRHLAHRVVELEQRHRPRRHVFVWHKAEWDPLDAPEYMVNGQGMTAAEYEAWYRQQSPDTTVHVFVWVHQVDDKDLQ